MKIEIVKCELGCCDNCIWYKFDNSDCTKHKENTMPWDTCDDFICFVCNRNVKRGDLLNEKN